MKSSQLPNAEIKDLESQSTLVTLRYLRKSDCKKLNTFLARENTSLLDLDDTINTYWKTYYWYQFKFAVAAVSWAPAIVFQAEKSNVGINALSQLVLGKETPSRMGYGLGAPIATLGTGALIFSYNPRDKALEATLNYAESKPLLEQAYDWLDLAKKHPIETVFRLGAGVANIVVNTTGAMVPALGFASKLNLLSIPARVTCLGLLAYPQYVFYRIYFNTDKGINFLKNKKLPWLAQLIWNGEIAVPLQIFIQGGLSAVGLRAYPFYYFIAKACEQMLGGWFPVPMVVAANIVQSMLTLYVLTYERYLANRVKADELLDKIVNQAIEKFIHDVRKEVGFEQPLSGEELEKKKLLLKKTLKQLFDEEIISQKKMGFVFREEKATIATVSYRSFIGGAVGYFATPFIVVSPYARAAFTIGGAFAAGKLLYNAEKYRITDGVAVAHYEKILGEEKPGKDLELPHQESCCEQVTMKSVMAMVVATGLLNYIVTLGTLETPVELISAGVALLAAERMINTILMNRSVANTFKGLFEKVETKVSVATAGVFHRKSERDAEEKKQENSKSWWKCW